MSDLKLIQRIKEEIANDPDKKGYAKKTPEQIASLMNSPTVIVKDIIQPAPDVEVPPPAPGTIIGQSKEIKDAPVLRLVVGIPSIPNTISVNDVMEAQK